MKWNTLNYILFSGAVIHNICTTNSIGLLSHCMRADQSVCQAAAASWTIPDNNITIISRYRFRSEYQVPGRTTAKNCISNCEAVPANAIFSMKCISAKENKLTWCQIIFLSPNPTRRLHGLLLHSSWFFLYINFWHKWSTASDKDIRADKI